MADSTATTHRFDDLIDNVPEARRVLLRLRAAREVVRQARAKLAIAEDYLKDACLDAGDFAAGRHEGRPSDADYAATDLASSCDQVMLKIREAAIDGGDLVTIREALRITD